MADELGQEQERDEPVEEQVESESGEERLAALEDQLKRVAADFDNYRKRAARERSELTTLANERLVKELLPILDDLERALLAAAEHEEAQLEEGVRLVFRSLAGLLQREGLTEIETDGRFDPHVHEALLSQPSEQDEGAVIDVIQKGYKLGDRVLRPARVVVSGGAAVPPVRESGPGEGDSGEPAAEPPVRDSGPGEGDPGEPGSSPGSER